MHRGAEVLTISNNKNDEIGTETWTDFFCVIVRKSGKFGFFTKNGKLIDPIYEAYAIDPCGGEIHVKTNDGYGVLSSPEYFFEELPFEYSLFSEMFPIDDDN